MRFVEHSEDVIHSFWVPEFLFKRDVIPYGTTSTARDNQFEITATTTGSFVGRCAELCGTYHSQMNFEVRVVSESTFENYLGALGKISSGRSVAAGQGPGGGGHEAVRHDHLSTRQLAHQPQGLAATGDMR